MKRISAAVVSLAAAALSLTGATAAQAAPSAPSAPPAPQTASGAGVGTQNILTCSTEVQGKIGGADCTNNTTQVVAFRAVVVCGTAPDQTGPWVTLNPGQSGHSNSQCPAFSSGVGSVSWEEG